MRVITSKLYCDKCGKLLKGGFLKDFYTIPIAYKSIVWGIDITNVTLCKECTKEYFKVNKQFLQKADIDDKEGEEENENN
jgi:hypothetical protein